MAVTRVTELPPSSLLFFEVERDELGNEVYVGAPMVIGDEIPIPASYASPPAPRQTNPEADLPPGGRNLFQTVREGITISEADRDSIIVSPGLIEGWDNQEAIREADGVNATTASPGSGYSSGLALSEFDMSGIPDNATITGVRVTVKRSKI